MIKSKRSDEMDDQRERDFAVLDEIASAFSDVPADELERQVAKAIAEVRAESVRSRGATLKRGQQSRPGKSKS